MKKLNNPDYLHGSEAYLEGTKDADKIAGLLSDDTIVGGDGNDVLNGDSDSRLASDSAQTFAYSGLYSNGGWGLFDEFNGWKHEGNVRIEVHKSGLIGTTPSGHAIFELDSTANSTIYRVIDSLDPSMDHTVSFDFSARPDVSRKSNTIEVY